MMINKTHLFITLVALFIVTAIISTGCGSPSAEPQQSTQNESFLGGKYKTNNPHPINGVDIAYLHKLVEILASDALDNKTKDSCVFYTWNAFSDPIQFDTRYTYFSTQCLRLLANGKLDKEEKPFLTEWSYYKTDLEYLRFVLDRVLSYYHCKSYGDDTDGIGAALHQIKQTSHLSLPKYGPQETSFQYLRRLNETVLRQHHKVALMEKDYFNIYACADENVQTLKELARKISLELVEP
jgi:hypothetical protein